MKILIVPFAAKPQTALLKFWGGWWAFINIVAIATTNFYLSLDKWTGLELIINLKLKKLVLLTQLKNQAHPPPFDFNIAVFCFAKNSNIKIFTMLLASRE